MRDEGTDCASTDSFGYLKLCLSCGYFSIFLIIGNRVVITTRVQSSDDAVEHSATDTSVKQVKI